MRLFPTRVQFGASMAVALIAFMLLQAGTLAQGTPVAADPSVPAPEECQIPLPDMIQFPADSMQPIAATPRPIEPEPAPPFAPPDGEPADAETAAAVSATVRESIACRNAGDVARTLVFFTPNMLVELFGSPATVDPEILVGIQEGPRPVPAQRRLRIDAVDDIVLLPDGRAAALVETSTSRRAFRDYVFFVLDQASGRWLIDSTVPLTT